MKCHILYYGILLGSLISIHACREKPQQQLNTPVQAANTHKPEYDSLAALKYGADDYGMKKYVMAFLKKGPNRSTDSLEAMKLQTAHLENIMRMAEEGKLVLAGPFFGEGDIRGIYIFNVPSIEEAEALTNTDPAIAAGSLVMELKEWYGPAGLIAVNRINKSLTRRSILKNN